MHIYLYMNICIYRYIYIHIYIYIYSSVDIEVIGIVSNFIFCYERYSKHLKHKQKHLSNIHSDNIHKQICT